MTVTETTAWEFRGVYFDAKRRRVGRWVAVWRSPDGSRAIHDEFPAFTGDYDEAEAEAWARANPAEWAPAPVRR